MKDRTERVLTFTANNPWLMAILTVAGIVVFVGIALLAASAVAYAITTWVFPSWSFRWVTIAVLLVFAVVGFRFRIEQWEADGRR